MILQFWKIPILKYLLLLFILWHVWVKFFGRLIIRRNIPCSDFLVSRGVNLFYGRFCTHCMGVIEDVDHIILLCPLPWHYWSWFFNKINLPWIIPRSVWSFLLSWFDVFRFHRYSLLWNLLGWNICWCIWKRRNRRVFYDQGDDVTSSIIYCSAESVSIFRLTSKNFSYSVMDVYRELYVIFI